MEKSKLSLALVGLVSRFLSTLEALLPAALVAWNASLKAKAVAAKAEATLANAELKGEKDANEIAEKASGLTVRELLDRGVGKARARSKSSPK